MEKVAIILPPSPHLCDERVFPQLGPLRVAGALTQAGVPVDVLDCSGYQNYAEIAAKYAGEVDSNIFAIGTTTPQLPNAESIIKAIRQTKPSAKVILGGVHVTTACASYKREKKIGNPGRGTRAFNHLFSIADVLISGDGEKSILIAIGNDSPNLIDADDPESPLFLQEEEVSQYPFPRRDLIDLDSYHYLIDGVRSTSLISQLGCPMQCNYCGARLSPSFRRMRLRDTANVIEEIKYIYENWKINGLFWLDDELNINPNLIRDLGEFRKLQDRLGVQFYCRGFLKSERITEPQAKALRDSGFTNVLIGFENAHPRILKNIRKMATREQNTRAMEICHKVGLKVKALMSIGHAGESHETIESTKDWLIQVQPHDMDITMIQPYLSTPIFDEAVETDKRGIWVYTAKDGDRLYMKDITFHEKATYYKGIPGEYEANVFTDFISSEELAKARDQVELEVREKLGIKFYSISPSAIYEHSMGQGFPSSILKQSDI